MSARAAARRRHARRRSRAAARRVDARRARRHLRRLVRGEFGRPLCPERAAKLAGVSAREVERLLKGRGRESVRSISRETERRILAIKPRRGPAGASVQLSDLPPTGEALPWLRAP